MSLYTNNRERTTGIEQAHARLMAAAYWPQRGKSVEASANRRLDYLAENLSALAQRLRPYTVFTSDTDCDGTSFQAHRRWATDANAARGLMGGMYDVHEAVPEQDWLDSLGFAALAAWDQDYYCAAGYITLGNTWS